MNQKSVRYLVPAMISIFLIFSSCGAKQSKVASASFTNGGTNSLSTNAKPKVIFVELGSVKCTPCKMMQPVMKQVEEKFKEQVKVIFIDVWTEEGKPYGEQFGIRAIPTQIFLDGNTNEYYRHEGFFPFEELVKILAQKGVK